MNTLDSDKKANFQSQYQAKFCHQFWSTCGDDLAYKHPWFTLMYQSLNSSALKTVSRKMMKWRADSKSSLNAIAARKQSIKREEKRLTNHQINEEEERDINLIEDTDVADISGKLSNLDVSINSATHVVLRQEPMTNTECEQRHKGKRKKDLLQKGVFILQKVADFRIGDLVYKHRVPQTNDTN